MDHGTIVALDTPENLIDGLGLDNRIVFVSPVDINEEDLKSLASVSHVEKSGERYTVSGRGDLLIKEVIDFLTAKSIRFRNVRSEQPDLEDAFLELTGRRIRE